MKRSTRSFSTGGPWVRRCAERSCVSYEVRRRQPLCGGSLKRILWILFNCAGYTNEKSRKDKAIMAEKRSAFLLFLNTKSGEAANYALVGDGVTELSISYNPQTNTEQYIHQDTANTELTGYQPNAPVTAQAVKGDGAFDYINEMRKRLPIGKDAHTDIIMVDVFEEATGGSYPAQKQPVSIQIDSYGGAASDPLSIGYTINWRGSGEAGTFNPDTKTFTPGTSAANMMEV